jgi:hypothetical protein
MNPCLKMGRIPSRKSYNIFGIVSFFSLKILKYICTLLMISEREQMPKPKDLTSTVDFLQARKALLENPVGDTIRDTIHSDTTITGQDTLVRDTISPDTVAVEEIVSRETPADTLMQDTVATPADTTRPEQEAAATQAQPQPAPRPATRRQTPAPEKRDTTADLYDILNVTELPIADRLDQDPAHHNFLYHIPAVKPADTIKSESIYQPTRETPETTTRQEAAAVQELPAKPEQQDSYDWVTIILVGSLLLIGWTRLFYKKYFIALLKSFHFYNYAASLYFGRNSLTERAGILLNLNFFVTGGLVLFQAIHHSSYSMPTVQPVYLWLILSGFLLAWYIWNFMMSRLVGFLFLRQRSFNEYFHNYNLYRKLMGISLMPLAVIVQFIRVEYREYFLIAGGAVAGILFIVHIMRGLQVFMKEKVSIFYLFLYLCALEILPLFIVFEVFIRTLSS